MKLADKLHNLRDIDSNLPVGWTTEYAQEYFRWAACVVNKLRGTCIELEDKLDVLFVKWTVDLDIEEWVH